ncbi:MAG: translesion error-prone DNA polymerase V autoproteolytic subunit [Candidatus Omnitrophica bacterium]|nr:translesion error-prone DNA polymerase V autoproteolytic subunit [Candidatus Omnitrophota bacterium]
MKDEKKYNYKYNENVGAVIAPNRNNIRLSKIENKRPLFVASISAGFPSPADDFIDRKLDLNEFLIKHPASTFFVKVEGDSMIGAGIHSGDMLIVDRSLKPNSNKIIIAVLNGELTVKRIKIIKNKIYLVPENNDFQSTEVTEDMGFEVWGVVTQVIHPV